MPPRLVIRPGKVRKGFGRLVQDDEIKIETHMKTDHVTRDDLRAMRHGETKKFELPSPAAVYSARANAHILAPLEGCKFVTVADLEKNTLTVTRYDR